MENYDKGYFRYLFLSMVDERLINNTQDLINFMKLSKEWYSWGEDEILTELDKMQNETVEERVTQFLCNN